MSHDRCNRDGNGEPLEEKTDADIMECLNLLRASSIRVVVFDMDQTAVTTHSRGRQRRSKLSSFLEKVSPDFRRFVPQLYKHGYLLSIATHSDECEFETGMQRLTIDRRTHILGKELAKAVLDHCFGEPIASSFFIVAYNPRARGQAKDPHNCIKRYHMREIQHHYSVKKSEILLFDDTVEVVDDCARTCNVRAVQVDPKKGFRLDDLLQAFSYSQTV